MTIDLTNPADRAFAFGVVFLLGVACGLFVALVLNSRDYTGRGRG